MNALARAVLLVGLFGSGCTSGGESNAAFCPVLVDATVESAVAAAAVSPAAGPDAVNARSSHERGNCSVS